MTTTESHPGAPASGATQGLWIFVTSLSILFGGGLVLYVAARTGWLGHAVKSGAPVRVGLPVWFWVSTFVILVSSVSLHQAVQWARMGLGVQARRALFLTTGLGWLFLVFQVPGLSTVIRTHRHLAEAHVLVYALVLFLVGLHALHVVGGLVPMTLLARRFAGAALEGPAAGRMRTLGIYWHFLALVWIVLFSFLVLLK
jgi:heme/copper-type cytochrome/quinol oxidase subunit 3